jgi:hypothetical protein
MLLIILNAAYLLQGILDIAAKSTMKFFAKTSSRRDDTLGNVSEHLLSVFLQLVQGGTAGENS